MKVFVDTGAFIALADSDDRNHRTARAFYEEAKTKGARFVTTNFVVCETMNYLRMKISHDVATAFREGLGKSGIFEVLDITSRLNDEAFRIFRQFADKDFSFTDCTSFAFMKAHKIRKAFAFDRHFEQFPSLERLP